MPRSLRSLSWIFLSLVAAVDFATLSSTSRSLSGLAPFSHRNPPARVKRRCAFRLRVRLQPLLASTRPLSLFTDICVFSCQLFYRDAIFFSSPQLAKKRRQIRVLDFGVPSVLHSISKFFEFLYSIARLHMGRSLRSAVRCHYLQTFVYSVVNCFIVTPFSLARHSSLRKEGKSASWISLSLSSAARLASPVLASSFALRTSSFQSRRPSGNPLLF